MTEHTLQGRVDGGHCLRRGPDFSSFVEVMFDAEALDPTRAAP